MEARLGRDHLEAAGGSCGRSPVAKVTTPGEWFWLETQIVTEREHGGVVRGRYWDRSGSFAGTLRTQHRIAPGHWLVLEASYRWTTYRCQLRRIWIEVRSMLRVDVRLIIGVLWQAEELVRLRR